MGQYEDPNVEDYELLVKVGYATDLLHDAQFQQELKVRLDALALEMGIDAEIVTREEMAKDLRLALGWTRGGGDSLGNEMLAEKLAANVVDVIDPPLRCALVTSARSRDEVAAFLPSNFYIAAVTEHGVVICGQDAAGWTLDGYVIPRLASGLLHAQEITQDKALALVDAVEVQS